MAEFKPQSYFLRPHFVYFSLGAILAIHILTSFAEVPAGIQLIVNSLACLYIGVLSTSKIRFNKCKIKLLILSNQSIREG